MSRAPQLLHSFTPLEDLRHHVWVGVLEFCVEQVLVLHLLPSLRTFLYQHSIHFDFEVLGLMREGG